MQLNHKRLLLSFFIISILVAVPVSQGATDDRSLDSKITPGIHLKKYPGNFTCFRLESDAGVTVITDPYQINEMVKTDIVTESHQHGDHCDVSKIIQPYRLVNTCGVFNIKGVKITGIPGRHNRGDRGITNIIYVFELDGIRIAQFASQGEMLLPETLDEIGDVDILIIQIGSFEEHKLVTYNVEMINQKLKAKIVIPAHGITSPKEYKELTGLLGNEAIQYIPSGQLCITKSDLEGIKNPQLMVLDN